MLRSAATARVLTLTVFVLLCLSVSSPGDVALPARILNPNSSEEAWNVIRLSTTNVERLIEEDRLGEIPVQISLCSPALRALTRFVDPTHAEAISKLSTRTLGWVVAIARTSGENNQIATADGFKMLKQLLLELGTHYDPKVLTSDIFFCPLHSDVISTTPGTSCEKCGAGLCLRHIPYSFIYTAPAEASILMTAHASAPIKAGKKVEVKVKFAHKDKAPVLISDLMVMHTQPIHLLIEDPSLSDYHLAHPVATSTPGEYSFSFTPAKTSPYRIWADIVPKSTGAQELPHTDLPSAGKPNPVQDNVNSFTATAEGYQFALTFVGGNHIPIKVGQVRKMAITVTDAAGQPVTILEPVMNAFAHLVGFYSDYETVVHFHPNGSDILNPEARGGPAIGFQFFPPKAGFMRLYCQIMIGGKMIVAPLNLNVVP